MAWGDDAELGLAVAVQVAGMAIPVLVLAAGAVRFVEGLPAGTVVVVVAAAFVAVSWGVLERSAVDDVDFLLGSVIGPVLAFLGIVAVRAALWQLINFTPELGLEAPAAYWWRVIEVVAPHDRGLFAYVGAYAVAGFAAVFLTRRVDLPPGD